MRILIDCIILELEALLRSRGWTYDIRSRAPQKGCSSIRVFTNESFGSSVITMPWVGISPKEFGSVSKAIDGWFRALEKKITRILARGGRVSSIIFQGGGSVPMPEWFKEFCQEFGIEIIVLEPVRYSELSDERASDEGSVAGANIEEIFARAVREGS